MPKSPIRRRRVFTPPTGDTPKPVHVGSPRWLVPLMVGCFVIGLLWVVVFYITQRAYPIPDIGLYNMLIGFSLIMVGFVLATRWR